MHHDLIVIGSGSGNSLLTPELAGLDVAIVEAGTFGGTCLNVGCIPTKMFVLPAERATEAADAARLGVHFASPRVDWPAIRDRIFGRIDPISAGGERYRREDPAVTVYAARARFVGDRRLALSTGEQISADRIVVAAGGRAVGLDVEGLREPDPARGVHTSDTVMRMEGLPRRMVVVGGGFVACEFAHIFSALGVDVVQVQRSGSLLRAEETEIQEVVTRVASARHTVHLGATVRSATYAGDAWALEIATPAGVVTERAEAVLLAVGRQPNTDLLDPAAGGLACHDDGRLVVDAQLRTTAPEVWALGDVSSAHQLKHVANHEARIVAHNLAVAWGRIDSAPREVDDRPIPHAVFTHPQVASFGPTRAQLASAGVEFVSATQRFGDTAYGWALEDTDGLLVVHARPDGTILAAHSVGPQSSTLIQPLIQAATFGQLAHDVARGQYWIHPALAEVVENALLTLPRTP
ncbi:MAG TPA: mycothione reductase [Dermatophilaceae bacterium]|nr:mycothione reductase [Dermatophilaceae bacterium]